jgi:VWFA-related protein
MIRTSIVTALSRLRPTSSILDVSVIDQNNNPIFDLKKDDFQVFEDKVPQPIEDVSRAEVPVSLGLVIDTSGSMRAKLQTVSDCGTRIWSSSCAQDDEAFVAQFKAEPELLKEFTSDRVRNSKTRSARCSPAAEHRSSTP